MEDKIRESYIPEGTCAKNFVFDVHKNEEGEFIFDELRVFGGKCPGNAQVLNRLAKGKRINDLIPEFKNIICNNYRSCFSELAKAFENFLQKQAGAEPMQISHKRKKPLINLNESSR